MSNNGASEGVTGGIDMKFIMEALTSEIKRIFRAELEQFHERVEQSFKHPRNPPTRRRRERLPRRGARVEEEYTEEILRMRMIMILLLVTRGMEGGIEKLGIGKIIILKTLRSRFHLSKERMTTRHILSGRRRWSWFLIVIIIPKIRR